MAPPLQGSADRVVGNLKPLITDQIDLSSAKYPLPIYTLSIVGGKTYVVNAPDLVMAVHRNPKILNFGSLAVKFATRLLHPSEEGAAIMMENGGGEHGDWGFSIDAVKGMHNSMAPGAGLDDMNRPMIQALTTSFKMFESKNSTKINMLEWIRHELTQATTYSVYGPMNPYKERKVEDGFWNFVDDTMMLVLDSLPSLLARKGYHGRKIVTRAFEKYLKDRSYEMGSTMAQTRLQIQRKYRVTDADMALFETGAGIGMLANTIPSAFWVLFYVFMNPSVLADVRAELDTLTKISVEKDTVLRTLDISRVRGNSLLISIFQESLRHRSSGAIVRMVTEDVILDNRYLLMKGSVIQVPTKAVHFNPSTWGPTVHDFDHRRFLKTNSRKQHPGPFSAWGGGANVCAGRHFAMTEILSLVAMFAVNYDMTPASGSWMMPDIDERNMSLAVSPPKQDISVEIVARKGRQPCICVYSG